jgi:hypothetical protein
MTKRESGLAAGNARLKRQLAEQVVNMCQNHQFPKIKKALLKEAIGI